MGAKENQVQKSIVYLLNLAGAKVWRNNTRTFMVPGVGGKPRPMFFGEPGSGDVFAILPPDGHFLAVECKAPKSKTAKEQRERQERWAAAVRAVGGTYILAKSTIEVERFLKSRGLLAGFADSIGDGPKVEELFR